MMMSLVQLFPSLSSVTNMSITAPSCDINSAQHPLPCTYIGLCLFLRFNWCVWSNEARFDWNATLERQTAHFWTAPATHKNAVTGAAMVAAWCTSRMIHRSERRLTRTTSWPIQKYSCSMCWTPTVPVKAAAPLTRYTHFGFAFDRFVMKTTVWMSPEFTFSELTLASISWWANLKNHGSQQTHVVTMTVSFHNFLCERRNRRRLKCWLTKYGNIYIMVA